MDYIDYIIPTTKSLGWVRLMRSLQIAMNYFNSWNESTYCSSVHVPEYFFVYYKSFQTNDIKFTTNYSEKFPSSIRCQDSNSQPSEHESPPLTTRPRLPASAWMLFTFAVVKNWILGTYWVLSFTNWHTFLGVPKSCGIIGPKFEDTKAAP